MAGINRVILVGHLGKDPEVKSVESGIKVARFSLATTESYKDKNGERKEITEWHNIVCWRNLAEIAEKYLVKGKLLYLEGKIRSRSWEDNGIKRYSIEIVADGFTMLGSKNDTAVVPTGVPTEQGFGKQEEKQAEKQDEKQEEEQEEGLPPFLTEEDDLPF
jgi:single-strand DNA-binding protein